LYIINLQADDLHSVLGRLLARIRLAAVMLDRLDVAAVIDGYAMRVVLLAKDAAIVDRLIHQIEAIEGIGNLNFHHYVQAPCGAEPSALPPDLIQESVSVG